MALFINKSKWIVDSNLAVCHSYMKALRWPTLIADDILMVQAHIMSSALCNQVHTVILLQTIAGMCLMKIALDYVPAPRKYKRIFFVLAASCFMLIGSFLFGIVTVQSIMADANPSPQPITNASHCL